MNTKSIRTLGVVIPLAALVAGLLATPPVASAHTSRIQQLDRGRGHSSMPTRPVARSQDGRALRSIQLQGVVRRGGSDTIVVGRTAVRVTPRTAIESVVTKHRNASLSPRVLAGRTVTVFGRPTTNGKVVEATLLIVRPEGYELLEHDRERQRERIANTWYLIPSPHGGPIVRVRPGAPD